MACIATSMASLSLANAAATRRAGKPAVALSARRSVAAQPRVASHAGVAAGRGSLQVFAVRSRSNTGGSRKGLMQYVERVNAPQMKDDLIPFRVGMTVRVGVTVVEGNKTRVQPYEGIIIGVHKAGVATTITVRKAFQGYGVERIFPIHSPLCTSFSVFLIVSGLQGLPSVPSMPASLDSCSYPGPPSAESPTMIMGRALPAARSSSPVFDDRYALSIARISRVALAPSITGIMESISIKSYSFSPCEQNTMSD